MNTKIKRANWPAIEKVLRANHREIYVDKYNKTNMRKYYVNGVRPDALLLGLSGSRPGPSGINRVLFEPDSDVNDWIRWYREKNSSAELGCNEGGWFLQLQGGSSSYVGAYFGENSIFSGKEAAIYEVFYSQYSGRSRFPVEPEHGARELLSLPGCIFYPLSRIKVNPHYVSWRFAENRFEQIKNLDPERFCKFDVDTDAQYLARSVCAVEWAHRYSEKFSPLIKPMIALSREFYTNSLPEIHSAYEQSVDAMLENWVEATAAGGTMTLIVRYDEPKHMNAILPLLDPSTRYPCEADDPPDLVRSLPLLRGRSLRISYYLVRRLWEAGFSANSFKTLNDRTLIVELPIPLSRVQLYQAVRYLIEDATDLKNRIEARKDLPGDSMSSDRRSVGDLVYFVKPLIGKPRIGAIRRIENFAPLEEDESLEDYKERLFALELETESEPAESEIQSFMMSMVEKYDELIKHGDKAPGSSAYGDPNSVVSIDGFNT